MHWIFAYGSNMHLEDLARWLREDGSADAFPTRVVAARIEGYELAWNYRSVARAGGAANAMPCPGGELRGVALRGTDTLLAAIDRKEGHPGRYDRGVDPVEARALGSDRVLPAWLYRVAPSHQRDSAVPPHGAYLRLLIQAAEDHDLGAGYVARLREIPTLDDLLDEPDPVP